MRIGIMSMQRVCNYGSFLQAYALKKTIESLGHEVEFVDYKVEKPLMHNAHDRCEYVKGILKKNCLKVMGSFRVLQHPGILPDKLRYSVISQYRYHNVYWEKLGIKKAKKYHSNVDTLVIGSDEVFNCLQKNVEVGYSRELFGKNSRARKVITYAASFGNTTLQDLKAENIIKKIESDFNKISSFSVRDSNTHDIVMSITKRSDIIDNLDPVLIYGFTDVKRQKIQLDNFIIVYAYRGRLNEKEIRAIKDLSDKQGLKIVCLGGYHSFCDQYIQVPPLEIFDYFENARFVITDTYHGTIFSIIRHAKVGVFVRESNGNIYGNSEKVLDLLRRLGLESRVIDNLEKLEECILAPIDYDAVDTIIANEQRNALEYLKKCL